jgi:hypothetical protein
VLDHPQELWKGAVSRPTPVIFAITSEDADLDGAISDSIARQDDAFWHRFVRDRFTWRRFTHWWIARRFIVPRDIRKR